MKQLLLLVFLFTALTTTTLAQNVGVGTAIPNSRLEIKGAAGSDTLFNVKTSAGISRLALLNTGNVGIGTSAPAAQFHTTGSVRFAGLSSATQTNALMTDGSGNISTRTLHNVAFTGDLPAGDGDYIQNQTATNQTAGFRITGNGLFSTGSVAIGTVTPFEKLHVVGNILLGGTEDPGVSWYSIKPYSGSSAFNSGNGRELFIEGGVSDNNPGKRGGHLYLRPGAPMTPATAYGSIIMADQGGNTGIGTTNPNAKLDVAGTNSNTAGAHHLRIGNNFGYRIDASSGQNLILEWNNSGTWGTGITLNRVSGNVGVGTTTMPTRLSIVNDDANFTTGLSFGRSSTGNGKYVLTNSDNNVFRLAFASNAGTAHADYTNRMMMDPNGNVSIGGSLPNAKLEVMGSNIRISNAGDAKFEFWGSSSDRGFVGWEAGIGVHLMNKDNSPIMFSTTSAERMRIDYLGNVGIATTNPITRLDLGNATSGNKPLLRFHPGSATGVSYVGYQHHDFLMGSYSVSSYPQNYISIGYRQDVNRYFHIGSASDANFNGSTTFVPSLSVNSGGNVGIGTSTPDQRLELGGGGIQINGDYGIGMNSELPYDAYPITDGVKFFYSGNAYLGSDGLVIEKTEGADAYPDGGIVFVNRGYGTSIGTVALAIRGNDYVGINTAFPSYDLHINGVTASISWVTLSDARYKKDVQPLSNALDKILALNGVSYHFRKEEFPEINFDNRLHNGLLAQEVKEVLPELVYTDTSGYHAVNYNEMIPLLIEAVKELSKQNQELKKKVEELKR